MKNIFIVLLISSILAILLNFKYSSESSVPVSETELKQLTERLISQDTNNAARYLTLDFQKRTQYGNSEDKAPNKLFHIREELFRIPTIAKILPLYDNYELDAFRNEVVSPQERSEESALLDSLLNTTVLSETKKFLQSKNLVPKTDASFKSFMHDMWFSLYSRGKRKRGSSAFEHVFLAEIKNNQISGLHNWLYFGYGERNNQINYLGWMKKLDFPNQKGGAVKLKYKLLNLEKPEGSLFFGTSPELEMSLYTLCFLIKPNERCHISLGNKNLYIQTYTFFYEGRNVLTSAYPVI